jgi:bifunctional non-homologous end joining protein LigD
MSIETYKKKRDFKRTSEPSSDKSKKGSLLSFVVQRHDARRLHYDLRLEMENVLKSWAVPKGPSMVAGEKRLAIMVEDHPLSYGEFQGEIPKGNYGAGTVEIWDSGTYRPMDDNGNSESKLIAQLNKGDLKFTVEGKILKGSFALVRLNDEKNEWLLIKKKDEFARSEFDIEKIKPLSEKRSRRTDKSPKKNSEQEIKKNVIAEKFPDKVIRPMLAKLTESLIDNPDWIYEIKYDGYRIISTIRNGEVSLLSRNGNSYTENFNTIASELKGIKDNVIIDGEVVIENEKGLSDFQLLQNYNNTRSGELKYYVFDILYLNGHDVTNFPLTSRKELLEAFFKKYNFFHVYNTGYQTGNGVSLFNELSSKGYEGVIAKSPESSYLPGKRSDSWLKLKSSMIQEAVICGYTLPMKSRKYFGSLILGLFEEGELKYIGNCGTGFSDVMIKELFNKFSAIKTESSPFKKIPKLSYPKGKPVWLEPELVCNVKFSEWSREKHLRNPVFMGLREDKNANEVKSEKDMETESKQMKENKTFIISGKKIKCTNMNKIYWPDDGYTKGDLISYYHRISKYILPYLKNRPQSLNRHPNGITGKNFYHKNMDEDQLPEWMETAKMHSKSNDHHINYLLCNNTASLIYMANLGCIEINPWHSTYDKPDNPTYMMIDLDPAKIAFSYVIDTALAIKEICDEINILCYCKTSGATGLHIYIPLAGKYTYSQVKTFAELMAVITHHRLPDFTSIERSTAKRKDKIYIDFLQNRKGQTIAAPYSVRPRPLATVSTPLQWKEVNQSLSPELFTIQNIHQRLESNGDIWQPVLKKGVLLNKALESIEKLS